MSFYEAYNRGRLMTTWTRRGWSKNAYFCPRSFQREAKITEFLCVFKKEEEKKKKNYQGGWQSKHFS